MWALAAQPAPADLVSTWAFDPGVLVAVGATVVIYLAGLRRSWRRRGPGGLLGHRRVLAFAAAMVALLVALVSPLEALSEALFGAHMVQHLLLTLVVAPLLLLGRVHLAAIPLLPVGLRRRWARRLAHGSRQLGPGILAAIVGLHILTMLVWHVPTVYDAAINSDGLHGLEHLSLLGSALGFWAAMGAARPRPVATAGLSAFITSLVFVLLAALLTSASAPWYDAHLETTTAFGLTPLEDQQLAAAIMWVPGGLVYLGAAAAAIVRWIRADERAVGLRSTASS